jgi:hypothetical protein
MEQVTDKPDHDGRAGPAVHEENPDQARTAPAAPVGGRVGIVDHEELGDPPANEVEGHEGAKPRGNHSHQAPGLVAQQHYSNENQHDGNDDYPGEDMVGRHGDHADAGASR